MSKAIPLQITAVRRHQPPSTAPRNWKSWTWTSRLGTQRDTRKLSDFFPCGPEPNVSIHLKIKGFEHFIKLAVEKPHWVEPNWFWSCLRRRLLATGSVHHAQCKSLLKKKTSWNGVASIWERNKRTECLHIPPTATNTKKLWDTFPVFRYFLARSEHETQLESDQGLNEMIPLVVFQLLLIVHYPKLRGTTTVLAEGGEREDRMKRRASCVSWGRPTPTLKTFLVGTKTSTRNNTFFFCPEIKMCSSEFQYGETGKCWTCSLSRVSTVGSLQGPQIDGRTSFRSPTVQQALSGRLVWLTTMFCCL